MLGGDRLPPLAARKSNTDNSPDQGASCWVEDESEKSQVADVGVTGLYVLQKRDDQPGQRPSSKADGETSSSRVSAKNFKATDFASAVSQSITVRISLYHERVCGKPGQMPDNKKAVRSHDETNRRAVCDW